MGAVAGAIAGILYAPDKGYKTRRRLMAKGEEFRKDLRSRAETVRDDLSRKVREVKDKADELLRVGRKVLS